MQTIMTNPIPAIFFKCYVLSKLLFIAEKLTNEERGSDSHLIQCLSWVYISFRFNGVAELI